jgi:hypothetical protein
MAGKASGNAVAGRALVLQDPIEDEAPEGQIPAMQL